MSTQPPVFYLMHIPKTAGMSLQGLVRRRYKTPGELELVYFDDNDGIPFNPKQNLKLVMGHFRFGFHTRIAKRDFTYCTFLRNPIDQVVSSYYYSMDFPERVPNLTPNVNNVLDFARSNYGYNFQTRFVAGAARIEGKEEETLARAKNNLKHHFNFVGITEEFDLSLLMLAKLLGWKIMHYIKRNKGVARKKHPKPSASELQELREILKYDFELYALGKEIYESQKALHPKLEKRVWRFKMENALFQKLDPLYIAIKKLLGKA